MERALPENARHPENIDRLRAEFIEYYRAHKTDLSRPYPGIPDLLHALRAEGIRLAVASNKYHQGTVELVRHFFDNSLFSVVLGQRENIPVKPDPAIVHDILSATGIPASHTLYVGDSGVDMQTAHNSRITSIGVTWGFRTRQELKENGANHIVGTPAEIARIAGMGQTSPNP